MTLLDKSTITAWQAPRYKIIGIPLVKDAEPSTDDFPVVRGNFTSDRPDEMGDIITRAATERALPKYRQWSNVRYMHQPKPVAKVTRIGAEDGLAWNEVEIKIIDPQAQFDVKEGLLQALSIGILVKFDDVDFLEDGGLVINDYLLAEISLVDHPANYDAALAEVKNMLAELASREGPYLTISQLDAWRHDLVKGAIPYKDHGKADEGAAWSSPTLGDFTDQDFEKLSDAEKRRIAQHFTWTANMPPEAYGDLKLPHHQAKKDGVGPAVWRGVANAMARLNQAKTAIPDGDRKGCYNHLASHYKAFDKEPPEFKDIADETTEEDAIPIVPLPAPTAVVVNKTATEEDKSPACRKKGETKNECVARKIPEILADNPGMEQDQAVAIAESMCSKPCSEKSPVEEQIAALQTNIQALVEIIASFRKALEALGEVPPATGQIEGDAAVETAIIETPAVEAEADNQGTEPIERIDALPESHPITPEEVESARDTVVTDLHEALRRYLATRIK